MSSKGQRLNRSIRRSCWRVTQDAAAAAVEARGGRALKLPAMDSSDTCAECGRVDPKSRKAKRFRCTGCAHENDADVNAARVMRARTLRWLKLRAGAANDGEAHKALWDELKHAREEAGRKHTGGAGATTPRDGPATDGADGGAPRGHEESSI